MRRILIKKLNSVRIWWIGVKIAHLDEKWQLIHCNFERQPVVYNLKTKKKAKNWQHSFQDSIPLCTTSANETHLKHLHEDRTWRVCGQIESEKVVFLKFLLSSRKIEVAETEKFEWLISKGHEGTEDLRCWIW